MNTIEVKKVTVTPELATAWLDKNKINRKVRSSHVDSISNQIKDGNWMLTHQGVAFSESGILLDGQHRLLAVEQSKIPVEMFVFFGLKDDVFKAIDSGVKRSMADLSRLDQWTAEAATRVCHIVYSGRNVTPERVMKIGTTKFIDVHKKLMKACASRSKYYSAVSFRVSACLAVMEGNSFDYVSQMYSDLNLMNANNLPPIALSLIKQVTLSTIKSNNHNDTLSRGFKVFSEENKHINRLMISDSDIRETILKVKEHILSELGE